MKAYLCIGGHLDGLTAKSTDFDTERRALHGGMQARGRYYNYRHEYMAYNRGFSSMRSGPSMVWLHRSLVER